MDEMERAEKGGGGEKTGRGKEMPFPDFFFSFSAVLACGMVKAERRKGGRTKKKADPCSCVEKGPGERFCSGEGAETYGFISAFFSARAASSFSMRATSFLTFRGRV